ncbi:hypothetical protein [Flagellimonas algicola]|uniref:Uncharacterized protein n=1 Tax=Flagellimonas algicola TaxID=2583815 RepID=A0ABY2WND7_9FLAO|nr:hypothetical protein [Allomuricauda algicola]TMU56181.1 hypothetical protein FGG15_01180 [Allomuricauda algicola]
MKYTLLIILVCMASCKAQKEGQSQGDPDIVLIAQDGFSGIQEYEAAAIKDTKSLNKFYSRINRTRKPGLPVPVVDFSQEMVVVICLGDSKGQPKPSLARVTETDTDMSLALDLGNASKEEIQTTVISNPFYVFKMPLTTKKVDIQKVAR